TACVALIAFATQCRGLPDFWNGCIQSGLAVHMLELEFELAVTQFDLAFELAPEQFELDFDLAAAFKKDCDLLRLFAMVAAKAEGADEEGVDEGEHVEESEAAIDKSTEAVLDALASDERLMAIGKTWIDADKPKSGLAVHMLELEFELAVTQFKLAFELAPEQFELDFDLAAA
ncbi:unnamed protein product, partial [Cladocopium goreaui]